MREPSTYIKLDRNIAEWRWYQDANTFRVFVHLLIKANIRQHDFQTATIQRGELATSYAALASELGISVKNVRTAINHLKETGEVAVKRHSRFSVISILNYDLYQTQTADKRQASGNQAAGRWQQSKNDKNDKNKRTHSVCAENAVSYIEEYARELGYEIGEGGEIIDNRADQ